MIKDNDKHWYDFIYSPYFYVPLSIFTIGVSSYYYPEYTVYPVLSYFGLPISWEQLRDLFRNIQDNN
jgi:hypothetical protein